MCNVLIDFRLKLHAWCKKIEITVSLQHVYSSSFFSTLVFFDTSNESRFTFTKWINWFKIRLPCTSNFIRTQNVSIRISGIKDPGWIQSNPSGGSPSSRFSCVAIVKRRDLVAVLHNPVAHWIAFWQRLFNRRQIIFPKN